MIKTCLYALVDFRPTSTVLAKSSTSILYWERIIAKKYNQYYFHLKNTTMKISALLVNEQTLVKILWIQLFPVVLFIEKRLTDFTSGDLTTKHSVSTLAQLTTRILFHNGFFERLKCVNTQLALQMKFSKPQFHLRQNQIKLNVVTILPKLPFKSILYRLDHRHLHRQSQKQLQCKKILTCLIKLKLALIYIWRLLQRVFATSCRLSNC